MDAVSRKDAANLISRECHDAIYDGEYTPVRMVNGWDVRTCFVTSKRQEEISAHIRAEEARIIAENPWLFGKKKQGE